MKRLFLLVAALLPLSALAADLQLTWTQPTQNVDGTAIPATGPGSISSNRVEYGTCNGNAFGTQLGQRTITPAATTTTFTGLAPGTYCARGSATNTYGRESNMSNVVARTIDPPTPNPPVMVSATVARLWTLDGQSIVVGSIAKGTACGARMTGDWYTVDAKHVTFNRTGQAFRKATIVAKCA